MLIIACSCRFDILVEGRICRYDHHDPCDRNIVTSLTEFTNCPASNRRIGWKLNQASIFAERIRISANVIQSAVVLNR